MKFNPLKNNWIVTEPMIPGTKELERILVLLQAAGLTVYKENLDHESYENWPYLTCEIEDYAHQIFSHKTLIHQDDNGMSYAHITFEELESSLLKLIQNETSS